MLKLFRSTDTSFSTNGDKVINALKAKVRKEDNGAFYLDLEAGLEYVNDLAADLIKGGTLKLGSNLNGSGGRALRRRKNRRRLRTLKDDFK